MKTIIYMMGLTFTIMTLCAYEGFCGGGHTEGGGSELAQKFIEEAHRVVSKIKTIDQSNVDPEALVNVEDLEAILRGGIEIVTTSQIVDPQTGKPIDADFVAYATTGQIQLLTPFWEEFLKLKNAGKYVY